MAKALQIRLARLCWTLSARFNRADRLYQEAIGFALEFARQENGNRFRLCCSEHGSGPAASRAFVLLIEAARLLTVADDLMAARLLRLALRQIGLEDDDT
jgi:hypothetical protein